jgi:hypothetical protein
VPGRLDRREQSGSCDRWFVDTLDLGALDFEGVAPAQTGRPAYHPSVLLKLYVFGYLNRVQSSRRLEREAGRNVELMWLLGRLVPDHKPVGQSRPFTGFHASENICSAEVTASRPTPSLAADAPRP